MSKVVMQFMHTLMDLERKCLKAKVNEHGANSVIITAQELNAIDEAIKVFDLNGVHAGVAWQIQQEYDSHD